jgi:hypothetical protein
LSFAGNIPNRRRGPERRRNSNRRHDAFIQGCNQSVASDSQQNQESAFHLGTYEVANYPHQRCDPEQIAESHVRGYPPERPYAQDASELDINLHCRLPGNLDKAQTSHKIASSGKARTMGMGLLNVQLVFGFLGDSGRGGEKCSLPLLLHHQTRPKTSDVRH